MTPGARVAATIELIDEIVSQAERPADLVTNAYFRQRRFIGGGDRRAVSDRAWGLLRRWGQLRWWLERARAPELSGRLVVAAELMLTEGLRLADIDALYDGGRYRPALLDEEEARALRQLEGHSLPHPDQPDWVRLNVQEWVAPHLREAYGEAWGREIAALDTPPPVDLRVNRLKATPAEARRALADEGVDTEAMKLAPDGLRLRRRLSVVAGDAFKNGLVEIQDEGSQLVALLVDARPGMQVADYCAGAGGKTLAIAAGMNNRGRVVAMDVLESRLERSALRLRRAGAHNVERRALTPDNRKWLKRQGGAFDRVLVDAPCTGTGTWRRNPDGRWTLAPQDLEELVPKQAAILDAAARLVKPGGRLVYATCSVLPAENERQIASFLERHPGFAAVPVAEVWRDARDEPPPPALEAGPYLRLSPLAHGTDGFFAAVLQREAPPLEGEPEVVVDTDFAALAGEGTDWEPEGGTESEAPAFEAPASEASASDEPASDEPPSDEPAADAPEPVDPPERAP
ncbi:methyltransferase domain-containing protein [Reyranella sp.]|uniref:methyltransferase domain-containing protein n=1 Tax=Reyranella sp. TaxID=1929291 RepID=UPI003BABE571